MRTLLNFPNFKHGEMSGLSCSFENCSGKAICRGLCEKHYSRAKKGNMHPSRVVHSGNDEERFEAKFKKLSATKCWIWEGGKRPNGKGVLYGRHHLSNGKAIGAHRFSYEKYIGVIPQGYYVCHACDNPLCVNPSHLFIGTHKDNMNDMVRKGRASKRHGEKHHIAKLTNNQAKQIRNSKKPRKWLAKHYNVSESTIARIIRNESYIV